MADPLEDVPAYRLENAGFTREQTAALLAALRSNAVTKVDLLEMEKRLDKRIDALDARITEEANRLDSQITAVEGRLDAKITKEAARLKVWVLSTLLVQVTAFVALFAAIILRG